MRLLQLVTRPGELLDLHPQVTVVQGLDDAARAHLVGAVAALAGGRCEGEGLLEAHGVLFDLDPALLALLELHRAEVDPVVRPGDLPSQPLTVDARELRAREQAFSDLLSRIQAQVERHAQATAALETAAAAVTHTRTARADAEVAHGELRRQIDRRAGQIADLERALADLQIERAQAGAVHEDARQARLQVEDRTVAARAPVRDLETQLAALDEQIQALSAELDAAGTELGAVAPHHPDVEGVTAEPDGEGPDQLETAERRLAVVEHVLATLDDHGPHGTAIVRTALDALVGAADGDLVPSPDALALADELAAVEAEISADGYPDTDDLSAEDTTTVRSRLDAARAAVAEAEGTARSSELDPIAVAELDANHEALLEALDRADGRFGGGKARARVEELRATEDALLGRLGLLSYAERLMGPTASRRDPAREAALEEARQELAAAEDAWRDVERRTESALERAARLDRRRRLRQRAAALLGDGWRGPESADADLRALQVPRVATADRAEDLRAALDQVGVDVSDAGLAPEDLEMVATAWLAEADQVAERAAALEAEHGALLVEIDALRGGGSSSTSDRAAAEARLAAHEQAARRLAEAEAERSTLDADLAEARARAAQAEAQVAAARAAEQAADEQRAELDVRVAAAEAALATEREGEGASTDVPDLDALDSAVEEAERRHREALAAVEAESVALAALDDEGQTAASEVERLQDIVTAQGAGTVTEASELEWYLLARVASQRAVSVAGSLPLVLDDALAGLDAADVAHLLDRLERMAETVQVIVVSDDPAIGAWAEGAGAARAAVVTPVPI